MKETAWFSPSKSIILWELIGFEHDPWVVVLSLDCYFEVSDFFEEEKGLKT